MKASQLITLLQQAMAKHGDLEVGTIDSEFGNATSVGAISLRKLQPNAAWPDDLVGEMFIAVHTRYEKPHADEATLDLLSPQ